MNRDFQRPPPLAGQADLLASKGRFGDTMLVHMNPTEVDVLRQMTPGGQLTINPDTGQPEAFLPLLLGLAGGFLGGAGALGSIGALTAGAIGTGLGTTIETGSLKEGLKAGLISGLVGGVAGKLFQGADAVAGAGSKVGEEAVKQTATDTVTQGAIQQGVGTQAVQDVIKNLPGNVLAQPAPSILNQASQKVLADAAKAQASSQAFLASQSATPSFFTNVASGFSDPNLIDNLTKGGAAGLTGQAMADQFNLMNQPMGPGLDEDAEDFYVPVTADDRGVQFPGSQRGSSEFDYFANPFSFTQQSAQDTLTPVPSFKDGGMIDRSPRKFDVGGEIDADAPPPPNRSDYGGSVRQQKAYNSAVDRYEAQYGPVENYGKSTPMPVDPTIPSYFTNNNPNQAAESVGNDLDDMITEQVRQRVYTPRQRMMPSTTMSNIRGAGDVDFTDYNRRLLGAPTRMIDVTRPMTEAEITARDEAAAAEAAAEETAAAESSASTTSATSGIPQSVLGALPPGMDLSRVPPFVRAQIIAAMRGSIGVGGERGAPFDPTLPASDLSVPPASAMPVMDSTPMVDVSVPGDMGFSGSDGMMDMMDMMGGEGMGMGNVIPFNPVPPVSAAPAPATGVAPVPAAPAPATTVAPVPALPPISAGVNTPAFDPLAGMDFRGGRGGFEFSGPGGMYIGM